MADADWGALAVRDTSRMLEHVREQALGRDLWLFGYASLIWRPECEAVERRPARVHGYHRVLRMRSRVNRGTPERPGLVFALVRGGSCRGVVDRIAADGVAEVLERLWAREMPTGVYDPRWLPCRTPQGQVHALAFTLSRSSPQFLASLADDELLDILRHATGRYGTTLDYLLQTAHGLRQHGIEDRAIERLVRFARQHALILDEKGAPAG